MAPLDITTCPECGLPAEIEWRATMESTDGPVEHAKIRCVERHWFLLPLSTIDAARQHAAPRPHRHRADLR